MGVAPSLVGAHHHTAILRQRAQSSRCESMAPWTPETGGIGGECLRDRYGPPVPAPPACRPDGSFNTGRPPPHCRNVADVGARAGGHDRQRRPIHRPGDLQPDRAGVPCRRLPDRRPLLGLHRRERHRHDFLASYLGDRWSCTCIMAITIAGVVGRECVSAASVPTGAFVASDWSLRGRTRLRPGGDSTPPARAWPRTTTESTGGAGPSRSRQCLSYVGLGLGSR